MLMKYMNCVLKFACIGMYRYICVETWMDAYTRTFACYIMLPNCPLSLAFSQYTLENLFNRMVSLSAVPKKTPKWIFGWEFGR